MGWGRQAKRQPGRRGRQYANGGKGTIPFLGSGVRLSSVRQLLLLLSLSRRVRSVRKVLPRSSGITSPSFVVAEATQQNDQEKSRRQRSSPQWQYGRPVRGPTSFCPCPTGFLARTHTHKHVHLEAFLLGNARANPSVHLRSG